MNSFRVGHEIFDSISSFQGGSLILFLDTGHFESLLFLNSLLSGMNREIPVNVVSIQSFTTPFNFVQLDMEVLRSLHDLSVLITGLRKKMEKGVLIHHYLPHILIQHDEDLILQLMEHWIVQVSGKPFLEFYTLPIGTFPSFEKKLQALLHGTIMTKVIKQDEKYQQVFSISRACKPEYHGSEFPYAIKDNRLLIKWGDEFTDRLPTDIEMKVRSRLAYLREHASTLRVSVSANLPQNLTPYDHLILTQVHNMQLKEVELLFPDVFDEVLEKLARWHVQGVIGVDEVERYEEKPVKQKLSLATKMALGLPTAVTARMMGGNPHSVPIEALLGLRKSVQIILQTYLPTQRKALEELGLVEKFIHEILGRTTAAKRIRDIKEDPRIKLDLKYFSKIAAVTLHIGFRLRCKVKEKAPGFLEMIVRDCFACKGVKSDKPVCRIISGSLAGALSLTFKRKVTCEEVECKAAGGKNCTFLIRTEVPA